MTPSDYTIRCDPTTDCRHHLCDGQCGRPLRDRKTPSTAHPGTTAEYGTTGMCWKCHNQATMLQPEDLEDQRHIIMTDEQMISIWYRDPDHWEWLMQRRYRLGLGGSMQLQIRRLNEHSIIPTRAHATDAGFDIYSPIGVNIGVGAKVTIPTGLSIALPEGTVGLIYPRSSLGTKHDIVLANTVGVIDSGYRGEILIVIRNQGDHVHTIHTGDRIAQMIITPYLVPQIIEVTELPDSDRGERGFGSTGN